MITPSIEARGIIHDATRKPDHEKVSIFPGLASMRDGTLLAAYQAASVKQAIDATLRVSRSTDGGNSWKELPFRFETKFNGVQGSFAGGEMTETEPGRLLMFATWFDRSDPKRPLFDPVSGGIVHCKLLLATSTNKGDSWSPWTEFNVHGLKGCAGTGPILRWPDGSIAVAFESYREYDEPNPGHHAAWVCVSRDGGRSFGKPIEVAIDPRHEVYYWDQRLCTAGPNGEYVAMFWTHDLARKQDLSVHFKRGSIHKPGSEGISETIIRGQIAAPVQLPDGRVLSFVVDRVKPATLKLWVSHDGGKTWPEKDVLVVYNHEEKAAVTQGQKNIDYAQYWEDMGKWSFGHPGVHLLANGKLLLIHYAGTPDRMSIHWIRLAV